MLPNLPTELLLDVFAFLTVQEIRNIRLVSRSLDALIHENAESIYRAAALLHRFIFSNDTLEDIAWLDYPPGAEAQASWKDLCAHRSPLRALASLIALCQAAGAYCSSAAGTEMELL